MHLLPPNFGIYLLIIILDVLTFIFPIVGYYLCRKPRHLVSNHHKLLAIFVLLSMACGGLSIQLEMAYLGRLQEIVDIQLWYEDVSTQASNSLVFLGVVIFVDMLLIGSIE